MSAPYPTGDQRQYPGGMPPYPPVAAPGGYPPNAAAYPPQPAYPQPAYPVPGNYGTGPYQGAYDPHVGFQQPGYQQPGYPQPPPPQQSGYGDFDPNKPQNPPYMDDTDPGYKGFGFDDKSIRAGFIRRVYSILSIQLLVTLAFVLLFVYHQGVKNFTHRNPQLMFIPMVGTIVFVCMIACCESVRRNSPTNLIVLGLFTLCESIVVGFISSTYAPEIVLMAVAITAAIVIGLTLFAFQTKYDVTSWGGGLCVILIVFSIGSIVVGIFFRTEFAHFLVACVGAAIFCLYIVYDTQIMMGGTHKFSISPEEYVFAALNLYMDIIQLFIYMLRILQYLNKD
jgi:FtsH-binding integral membrane protein